jgi:hypothetical protein
VLEPILRRDPGVLDADVRSHGKQFRGDEVEGLEASLRATYRSEIHASFRSYKSY